MTRMPRRRQTRQSRPTLRDVAQHAGVAISTASLAFSGKGPVAPETVERVRAAASELGYAGPDPLAASFRQGRSGIVALVLEGRIGYAFTDPFALRVTDGLAQVLDGIPAGLLLLGRNPGDSQTLLDQLATTACDAVVFAFCGPRTDPAVDLLAARGIPMIGTGSPVDPRVPHLSVDERAASALATTHLTSQGHQRLAHVTLPLTAAATSGPVDPGILDAATYADAEQRARGFLDAAPSGELYQTPGVGVAEGEAAGRYLLDRPPGQRPTGIVAQSDQLAAGVLLAARDLGIEVPGQLSVVGFDGVDLPWLGVELTTIDQDGTAKGAALGAMVTQALAGMPVANRRLEVHLRIGETSGPAPRA